MDNEVFSYINIIYKNYIPYKICTQEEIKDK